MSQYYSNVKILTLSNYRVIGHVWRTSNRIERIYRWLIHQMDFIFEIYLLSVDTPMFTHRHDPQYLYNHSQTYLQPKYDPQFSILSLLFPFFKFKCYTERLIRNLTFNKRHQTMRNLFFIWFPFVFNCRSVTASLFILSI